MVLGDFIPTGKVGLGIDVRGGLLCHALLYKVFWQIRLLDWGVEELPIEAEQRDQVLAQKLADLSARLPKRPAFVTVGLSRHLATTRLVTMPAVGEEELREILEYEVERHIPFSPGEAQYDFQVLERDAEQATILLAAARKEEISRHLALLEGAGLKPTALGISTLASFNALLYNQGRGGVELTALLDLRDDEAELGVAKKGVLRYARHLQLGSAPSLDLLVSEICDLLTCLEMNGGKPQGRLALAGPGVGRGDLLHHLAERTGLTVEFLQPLRRVKAREIDPQITPSLGAAVGLALNGLVALPLTIDLLPRELAPVRRDPSLLVMGWLLLLIAAIGLTYVGKEAVRERHILASLTARVKQARDEAAMVEQLKGEVARLSEKAAVLERIDKEEVRKLDALRELAQILPKGVTLTLFSTSGREVRIVGSIVDSASGLISILEQSPIFENAQFASPLAKMEDGSGQEFEIKALLEAKNKDKKEKAKEKQRDPRTP